LIYTRFGSPVNIVDARETEEGFVVVQCQRSSDLTLVRDGEYLPLAELKADGGLAEIQDAYDPLLAKNLDHRPRACTT